MIPNINLNPMDSTNDVLNAARVRLNADMPALFPLNGHILDRTQASTQQGFNNAWRRFQEELVNLGFQVLIQEVILLNCPIVASLDPAVQTHVNWTEFGDGVTDYPSPVLPSDLIQPFKIWERVSGLNSAFPVQPNVELVLDGLPAVPKVQANRFWEWRNNAIYLPGSLLPMDLRIRYIKYYPDFVDQFPGVIS